MYRKHAYKKPPNNHNRNQPKAMPQESQAAIQARATQALLAAYEQQQGGGGGGGGGMRDSLDSLMPTSTARNAQNDHTNGGGGGGGGVIPGLEQHYRPQPEVSSSPQHRHSHQSQSHHHRQGQQQPLQSLSSPPAAVRRTTQQDDNKATSRIQHSEYADALQQQIRQKQQLDTKDPYADRRSLRKPPRPHQDSELVQNSDQSPYVFSSPLRGGGGSAKTQLPSQATYAQQLKDQISKKKEIHEEHSHHRQTGASLRSRRRSSEDIDDSLSSLSRMGGEGYARKDNQQSNSRRYADQLQTQINAKQQIQADQCRGGGGGGGGGGSVYTDKLGNRVGNQRSLAVNSFRGRKLHTLTRFAVITLYPISFDSSIWSVTSSMFLFILYQADQRRAQATQEKNQNPYDSFLG